MDFNSAVGFRSGGHNLRFYTWSPTPSRGRFASRSGQCSYYSRATECLAIATSTVRPLFAPLRVAALDRPGLASLTLRARKLRNLSAPCGLFLLDQKQSPRLLTIFWLDHFEFSFEKEFSDSVQRQPAATRPVYQSGPSGFSAGGEVF